MPSEFTCRMPEQKEFFPFNINCVTLIDLIGESSWSGESVFLTRVFIFISWSLPRPRIWISLDKKHFFFFFPHGRLLTKCTRQRDAGLVVRHEGSMLRQRCRNVCVGQHAAAIVHSSVSIFYCYWSEAVLLRLSSSAPRSPLSLLQPFPSADY